MSQCQGCAKNVKNDDLNGIITDSDSESEESGDVY